MLEHLGISAPDGPLVEAPRLSVQADELSELWVQRVHEQLAALEAPRRSERRLLRGAAAGG